MLTEYLSAAMGQAQYEILEEDHTFYGELPGFDGVYSHAETLEECRRQLGEVLEEWLFFRISRDLRVPEVGDLELAIRKIDREEWEKL